MNIEKLKNYNQKILAVIGSAIALLAIVGLFAASYFTIVEIRRSLRYNNQEEGILSEEKIEKLQKENQRQQLISYEIPQLIDSINMVYIIPVSHKNLDESENINSGIMGIMDNAELKNSDTRYSSNYYGSFNNLLIYYAQNGTLDKLFDNRVNFGNIKIEYFNDDILIFIEASDSDSYKDGVINLIDFKTLYIFSLNEKKLRKIGLNNADISHYSFINKTKDLLILFGIDHDQDGKFEEFREPATLMKYNYKKDELSNVVNEKINTKLQENLEGTK